MTPRRLVRGLATLIVLAATAASAWTYADARGSSALTGGRARDAALATGRQLVARLNTLDVHHLDADLTAWQNATTGPLHDQLARSRSATRSSLARAGTSTRGTVTDAALTELDPGDGTAKLIAAVTVAVTKDGTTTDARKRFEAGLTRTSGGAWRLTSLTALPAAGGDS
ncbi:hypothetical protein BIV57_18400 [Mangrovactinospora gilvigrisea]|uniref:SnoaL-like domain-containing protein n=1 Tax=Mangrovactinospora gilvigrisea TaxID=1428644 RepID=A0A1J7C3B7_9ACTN|nr:hypothetical protein BIV57_18400 [Mangrovactinospora gilvigrisea]